jgi:hypothetical protein
VRRPMQEQIMDDATFAKPTALTDAETPPSRPGAKFFIAVTIALAAGAYLIFGSSLGL